MLTDNSKKLLNKKIYIYLGGPTPNNLYITDKLIVYIEYYPQGPAP